MKIVKKILAIMLAASFLLGTALTVAATDTTGETDIKDSNWRCALWKKSLMTDANGNAYRDSEGNAIKIPIIGYVVTNVKSPVSAPDGVDAYLSGNGYQVTVEWIPSSNATDTLLGYYIYRSYDDREPIKVNSTMVSPDEYSFVDSSILKPGKIYTYFVVAHYDNGSTKYSTMNPKSSSVVWGIPQIPEDILDNNQNDGEKYVASIFSGNSLAIVITISSLIAAVVAWGVTVTYKKKKGCVESDDDE